jgi:small subunit ribosomal protein S6
MLNQYETVFILTPVLSEAQMKEAVEKFRYVITGKGGEIINEENWGLRKMAYPIQKKSTGFFNLIEFMAPGELIKTLEIEFKRDERVIRFLTTRLDKYSIEYAEKRRNKKQSAAKVTEE